VVEVITQDYFFKSPGAIFLDFGAIELRWYGLMYALAFITCYFVTTKIAKNIFSEDEISNLLYTAFFSGILGARIWYVILSWDYYSENLLEIIQIWRGGQSIQGGIVGAIIGVYFFQRRNFVTKLGLVSVIAPLGQAIGRWGNFFNEEAFGEVTNLPWKVFISHTGNFHHPTFLYESVWNLISFFIMLNLFQKFQKRPLILIGFYLCLYSIGRLVIEPIRTDSLMLWDFPAASLIAVLGLIIGSLVIILNQDDGNKRGKNNS
jgi:phosphatidylglycerol---prolipoprotein diacylglyceryl transferase